MHAMCAISASATHRQPKAWPIGTRLGGAIVATFVLFGARAAHADAVTDGNAIMEATGLEATGDPFLQVRSATITQLAVFETVNVIVGDYEPYCGGITAPPGASPEVAAIAAAHGAPVALHPASALDLDALRTTALTAIPHGQAKDDGIAVGQAAAQAILALRADDGASTVMPYTPGTRPGDWRPTPPDFTPAFRYRFDMEAAARTIVGAFGIPT